MCMFVCLSVSLFSCLSVSPFIFLSVNMPIFSLFISKFVCLPFCLTLSVWVSVCVCLSVYLSTCLSPCLLFVCPPICLLVSQSAPPHISLCQSTFPFALCLSVCLSFCLSVLLFVSGKLNQRSSHLQINFEPSSEILLIYDNNFTCIHEKKRSKTEIDCGFLSMELIFCFPHERRVLITKTWSTKVYTTGFYFDNICSQMGRTINAWTIRL